MSTEDDAPAQELALAAAAAGGDGPSAWTRQGRAAIQGSHSLSEPLARWAPEPAKRAADPLAENAVAEAPEFPIPDLVLRARHPQRLSEDTVCRSPIAGLVIAVMAAAGQPVAMHEPVLIVEAMKMQNQVVAKVEGVVKVMHVAAGDAVKAGQILFELG